MVRISFILIFISCSLIYPTFKVKIPTDYEGWCYVVPVQDESMLPISNNRGYYEMNNDGVVYISAALLDLTKSNIIKIYQENEDISRDMKYSGTVTKVLEKGEKYEFLRFYLPTLNERKITDQEYWREKKSDYYEIEDSRFKELLQQKKIKLN